MSHECISWSFSFYLFLLLINNGRGPPICGRSKNRRDLRLVVLQQQQWQRDRENRAYGVPIPNDSHHGSAGHGSYTARSNCEIYESSKIDRNVKSILCHNDYSFSSRKVLVFRIIICQHLEKFYFICSHRYELFGVILVFATLYKFIILTGKTSRHFCIINIHDRKT